MIETLKKVTSCDFYSVNISDTYLGTEGVLQYRTGNVCNVVPRQLMPQCFTCLVDRCDHQSQSLDYHIHLYVFLDIPEAPEESVARPQLQLLLRFPLAAITVQYAKCVIYRFRRNSVSSLSPRSLVRASYAYEIHTDASMRSQKLHRHFRSTKVFGTALTLPSLIMRFYLM